MPLNMVSMAIYVTLEGKIPRTPLSSVGASDGAYGLLNERIVVELAESFS